MKERIVQPKKVSPGSFSIPALRQPTRGFGSQSSGASSPEGLNQPLIHDISRIPLRRPQTKLTINQPGDIYEQEADAVAKQVMERLGQPLNDPSIQRQEIPEEDEEELQMKSLDNSTLQRESVLEDEEDEEELQMKSLVQRQAQGGMAATPDLEASINQARGGGKAIAPNIRQPMEQAFGADFSGVKVHTDGQSDELNQSIQARAFTTGQDVFFRQGEYNPGSRGGQELLAHELTHVVQQNGGKVQRSPFNSSQQSSASAGEQNDVMRQPFQPTISSQPETIQRVYAAEEYSSNARNRQIYVDPKTTTWGGSPLPYPDRDKNRAIMFETISTPNRIGNLIGNFSQRSGDDSIRDVGLSVVLNSYYVPPKNNIDNPHGNSLNATQAVPNELQLNNVQESLDSARNQIVNNWMGPPIAVSTATWERRYVRQNSYESPELEPAKANVPYARLRSLSATNPQATQIKQALENSREATTWSKMGDDDMPIPNPNNDNDQQIEGLKGIEEETEGVTTFATFGYNLTTEGTSSVMTKLLENVYAVEMELRDQLVELGALTYPIEPNTFYKFSNEQTSKSAWKNTEKTDVGGGGGQIKEGLKLFKSATNQELVYQKVFHTTMINTDAGGRNKALIDLLQPEIEQATQENEPTINYVQVEEVLKNMDQSYFRPNEWSAVATPLMGAEGVNAISQQANKLVDEKRREAVGKVVFPIYEIYHNLRKQKKIGKALVPQGVIRNS
jgi:hypothetical protein